MTDLAQRWSVFRRENPAVRAREAAGRLGVSEAELVASGCGTTATRLLPDWETILPALPSFGRVRATTRNAVAVHERMGTYQDVSVHGSTALVVGEDIDLRIFLNRWKFCFALHEPVEGGEHRSLQVFDADGASVHKIYLGETSDAAAYDSLVRRLRSPEQSPALAVESPAPRTLPRPDSEIDARGLAASWAALQDTHDFFAMLRQYSVVRTQAFRLVGPKFAVPAPMTSARAILEGAARTRLPIMVFVNSPGCIQIHTGTVERLKTAGPWLNVLDLDFNLHVREDLVGSAWVVRKPTADGVVTSLELYDSSESLVLQFFGRRKPGLAEDPDWRRAVESLCAPAVA